MRISLPVLLVCAPLFAGQTGIECPVPPDFERAVKRSSPTFFDDLGAHFAERKQFQCAISAFQEAVRLAPRSWSTRYNLALALIRSGNTPEAARQLRAVTVQKPDLLKARITLGALLQEMGELDAAVETFKAALNIDPHSLFALSSLGEIYAAQKLYPDAISYLKQAVAVAPNSARSHLNLGIVLAEGADLESALVEFSKAARLAPSMASTRYNRGRVLFQLRRYEEALPELNSAVRLAPDSWHAVYLLAITERELGNTARSTQLLQKSVALEPRNADAQYALGQTLSQSGMVDDAVPHWKKALEANPEHIGAHYSLFQAMKAKDPQMASFYQRRFLELQQAAAVKRQVETLDQMSRVSAEAKDWAQAIAQLDRAIAVCRECSARSSLHKKLGWIYIRSGDLRKSEQELEMALKFEPGDRDVQQWLKLIRTAPESLAAEK